MARGRKKANGSESARAAPKMAAGNVTQQTFLSHYDTIIEKLREKKSADSALANAYKAAERDGIDKKELKRAVADAQLTTDERELRDRRYRQYMEFLDKPVGFQTGMDLNGDAAGQQATDAGQAAADAEALSKHREHDGYEQGFAAGKAGASTSSNPYDPGSDAFSGWHTGWAAGQADAVANLGGATA
jgi:ribosome modulation factor/uncharacterized protein (UPF0335 family)